MIDIHSHIIPFIDDGASDIDMSLDMIKIASEDGTKVIYATPHYFRGYFGADITKVREEVNKLNEMVEKNNLGIKILSGQEIHIDHNILGEFKEGKIGTLNNSRYMLVELPMREEFKEAIDVIYELRLLDIVPIIAHPERYSYFRSKSTKMNDFISEGCHFQINSGSINGIFGREIQKNSEMLIKNGICSFIASDAHTNGKRSTKINSALETAYKYDKNLKSKIESNLNYLLKDENLEYNPEKIKEKKSIFDIFKK